jgi:Uma2 family endonuclease
MAHFWNLWQTEVAVLRSRPSEALTTMSTIFAKPPRPAVEYPDDNGEPMAENTLQFKWIVLVKEGLETLYRHDPDVFVAGDLLWYPVEGEPRTCLAPDTMVAFGRPKGYRGSYKQWEEGGVAPQVVFEILSPGNRDDAMRRKLEFYDRYGVDEYYLYDPDTGELAGWLRGPEGFVRVEDMRGHVSPRLGIRFEPGDGPDNLKIIDPHGQPFATHQELMQRAEDERRRAEDERRRAEDERQRADRLAEKLRELGIEPD